MKQMFNRWSLFLAVIAFAMLAQANGVLAQPANVDAGNKEGKVVVYGSVVPQAMEGARHVRSRQGDAVALLQQPDGLMLMREMWQLNMEATPALCAAYNAELRNSALKSDPSYSNRLGEAIDLEFQLPNVKWLVAQHCDLRDVLTDLAMRLRVVRDSSRIDQLADKFETFAR